MKKQVKLCPIFHFPPPTWSKIITRGRGGYFLDLYIPQILFKIKRNVFLENAPAHVIPGVLNQSFMKFYQFIDSNKYSIQSKFFFIVYCKNGKYECFFGVKYNCHLHFAIHFFSYFLQSNLPKLPSLNPLFWLIKNH